MEAEAEARLDRVLGDGSGSRVCAAGKLYCDVFLVRVCGRNGRWLGGGRAVRGLGECSIRVWKWKSTLDMGKDMVHAKWIERCRIYWDLRWTAHWGVIVVGPPVVTGDLGGLERLSRTRRQ